MGTNFMARIIPTKERKDELKRMIDKDAFLAVVPLARKMYESFTPTVMDEDIHGEIHLGKRSGGWKFLWNPNIYQIRHGHTEMIEVEPGHYSYKYIEEPDTAYYVYPLTKEGIKAFIDRPDVEVYDEYGEIQDKEEFFKMALSWTTWKDRKTNKIVEAWDSDTYYRENPKENIFSHRNEYTDFLESLGYKLSESKSDFYSDGLRFSTSTEFS